jgi:DNA-binding winged helix-turn-helix (wHTH) protein
MERNHPRHDHNEIHCDYLMTKIYDVGPFRLDAEAGMLTEAGVPVALGPRAVAVLIMLVFPPVRVPEVDDR